jgi:hypothetical protein
VTFSPVVEADAGDESSPPPPTEPSDAGPGAESGSEADATIDTDASQADARAPMDAQDSPSDTTAVDAGLEGDAASESGAED